MKYNWTLCKSIFHCNLIIWVNVDDHTIIGKISDSGMPQHPFPIKLWEGEGDDALGVPCDENENPSQHYHHLHTEETTNTNGFGSVTVHPVVRLTIIMIRRLIFQF